MYIVQYQYFDKKGNQKTKMIEKATINALITTMSKHLENNELYCISCVSRNLFDYDFTQHGSSFKSNY